MTAGASTARSSRSHRECHRPRRRPRRPRDPRNAGCASEPLLNSASSSGWSGPGSPSSPPSSVPCERCSAEETAAGRCGSRLDRLFNARLRPPRSAVLGRIGTRHPDRGTGRVGERGPRPSTRVYLGTRLFAEASERDASAATASAEGGAPVPVPAPAPARRRVAHGWAARDHAPRSTALFQERGPGGGARLDGQGAASGSGDWRGVFADTHRRRGNQTEGAHRTLHPRLSSDRGGPARVHGIRPQAEGFKKAMTELLSNPFVDFVSRVVLPGLSVLAALSTLVVLLFTLRRAGQTLTRSVTPQIECYLRARQSSQVFDFVIANFGLGSAYCVGFKLDADEDDFDAHKVIMKQRGTDTPFSIIEPGGQITNMFGFGPGLLGQDPALKPFRASVTSSRDWFRSEKGCCRGAEGRASENSQRYRG